MIDILDQLIGIVAEQWPAVYRAWPEVPIKGKSYAIVARAGRNPGAHDPGDGSELYTTLTYTVSIFDRTPEIIDDKIELLTTTLNKFRIRLNSVTSAYSLGPDMFSSQLNVSVTVDKRGNVYY